MRDAQFGNSSKNRHKFGLHFPQTIKLALAHARDYRCAGTGDSATGTIDLSAGVKYSNTTTVRTQARITAANYSWQAAGGNSKEPRHRYFFLAGGLSSPRF